MRTMRDAPPSLLVTKLRPPPRRDQVVERRRLIERLRPPHGVKLTLVAAPPGCGKTTLLGNWREIETSRRIAWLTLDEGDNDPVVLWSYVLAALRTACPEIAEGPSPESVGAAGIADVVLPRLVNELAEQADVTLILDDVHRLSGEARDTVAWLVEHAPATFHLVLATRSEPPLPLGALRAHGELLEVRAHDLSFTSEEAHELLNGRLELGVARADVDDLVERTEGWATGLYLAALSLTGAQDRHAHLSRFGGSSRHVVDFLVDEVLEAHEPAAQTLMLRTAVAERLCGPLCDAVVGREGAAEQLHALARTNLFLVPLDDRGGWYRFHNVFAQLLRVELEHREPSLAPELHRRASAWHRDHGSIEDAIEHALHAGAYEEAGALIEASWPRYASPRSAATVIAWLQRFPADTLDGDQRLLAVRAWMLSLTGRRGEAAQAIAKVEEHGRLDEGPLPDGFSSLEASLATLRALLPWGDVRGQYENALRAVELEGPRSPWRPRVCSALATAHYLRGQLDEADRWFEEAARLGERSPVAGAALAGRSLIAGERGDVEAQALLAEQAMTLIGERAIDGARGEAFIAMGVSLAAQGRPKEALALLERGLGVMRSRGQPLDLAEALVRQAPVLRALGERERAAAAIAEARATVESCPDPGDLRERVDGLERAPRARPRRREPHAQLSNREIGVLRMLGGPLSERDIGRELYLSHNTIHSHTRSIYRKLGVSTRAAALAEARARGVL